MDLGLHREEGADVEGMPPDPSPDADANSRDADADKGGGGNGETGPREAAAQQGGRRLWVRDLRRRLWWCTYSFDRLVSTCVGRPFGIGDEVITTELPSLLDDDLITRGGLQGDAAGNGQPSYKRVAHHYFFLRMLQSEIVQVLQHNQAQLTRGGGGGGQRRHAEMHRHLASPFLVGFDSFRSWRMDMDGRLKRWRAKAPTRSETGVAFSTEFLELNYWQAIVLLYRQSLSVPVVFDGEYSTADEVSSPATGFAGEPGDDEDGIYLKVAEAGQKIVRIYRQLHLSGLVSYTYLSTHHLFMAGISYLYAIWHSPVVRSRLVSSGQMGGRGREVC